MGLSLDSVQAAPGADKTEHIDQIKEAIGVLIQQAAVLSEDQLRDPVLDQEDHLQPAVRANDASNSENLTAACDQANDLANGDMRQRVWPRLPIRTRFTSGSVAD